MNILLIGESGDEGQAIRQKLASRQIVVGASRKAAAPHHIDLHDPSSIERLPEHHRGIDALVVAAGEAHFGL